MRRLSSIILILFGFLQTFGQKSPHGEALKVDCAACHTSSGWVPVRDTLNFDHNKTLFPLEGSHLQTDCKQCHTSLVFDNAPSQCINCHTDIHNMSVGNDCARCHSTQTWIVDHIPELHEQNGFPLVGAHSTPSCTECHVSETNLRFNPIGNDCINCHKDEYAATVNPNHEKVGYSTNCIECHDPFSSTWRAELVNHDFFPLVGGHDNRGCTECHLTGNYSNASPECVSCHMDDYSATSNPNHLTSSFSTNCVDCHNVNAWAPSTFDHDGMYFPIYSGRHRGAWNSCTECHTTTGNYAVFSCIVCHEHSNQTKVTNDHDEVGGFTYTATSCYTCHPTGDE